MLLTAAKNIDTDIDIDAVSAITILLYILLNFVNYSQFANAHVSTLLISVTGRSQLRSAEANKLMVPRSFTVGIGQRCFRTSYLE